jgi:septum formation protein
MTTTIDGVEPAAAQYGQRSQVVLGSRSPRRLELLQLLIEPERITVLPPRNSEEAGFDGLSIRAAIEARLLEIARAKCADVLEQIEDGTAGIVARDVGAVLTADTVIVAADAAGRPVVLGQPPADDRWRDMVRAWFQDYLLGRTHVAATAVCVRTPDGAAQERVVSTEVTFHAESDERLEWYLSTIEPRGKAGGYAVQGAGGLFVSRIDGSPTNVVGLPLRELAEMFAAAGVALGRHTS